MDDQAIMRHFSRLVQRPQLGTPSLAPANVRRRIEQFLTDIADDPDWTVQILEDTAETLRIALVPLPEPPVAPFVPRLEVCFSTPDGKHWSTGIGWVSPERDAVGESPLPILRGKVGYIIRSSDLPPLRRLWVRVRTGYLLHVKSRVDAVLTHLLTRREC